MSMPIVGKPDFAKDRAVGNPILPTPITQIFKFPLRIEEEKLTKFVEFFKLSPESCKNSKYIYVMGKKDKYYDLKLINEYKKKFVKKNYRFNYELFDGEHVVDRKVLKRVYEEL